MKPIQQRKLLRAIEKMKSLPPNTPQAQLPTVESGITQPVPLPMDIELSSSVSDIVHVPDLASCTATSEASGSRGTLTVRYIHCQNLFMFQAEEKTICNLLPTTTLEELIASIAFAEGVSEEMTLELFFSEGYPLDANKITLKGDCSERKVATQLRANNCCLFPGLIPVS